MKFSCLPMMPLLLFWTLVPGRAAPLPLSLPVPAPDNHWTAQWISPAASPVDTVKADWIWYPETAGNPLQVAPAGTRYFRRVLNLPPDAPIRSGFAILAADNHFTLFVNGTKAGHGDSWETPTRVEIGSMLRPGANLLAVEAVNDPQGGSINAAGLVGKFQVNLDTGAPVVLGTDATWKTSDALSPGWQTAGFDDTAWKSALRLGAMGIQPWGNVMPAAGLQPNLWLCWRKTFTLARKPAAAAARIAVDSRYWLWVNGQPVVFDGELKRGPDPNDTYYDSVDLAPYLKAGPNTVAILSWYWGKNGFSDKSSGKPGLLFEMKADSQTVRSDESWKMIVNPAYGTASGPVTNYRLSESPIHYDARAELGNWQAPSFNDSAWHSPTACGKPPTGPWNALYLRPIPQWKNSGLQNYLNKADIPKVSTGKPFAARLPYNAQITAWLQVDAPAGQLITMSTDDPLNEIRSEYVTKAGTQEFEGLAWMNGHHVIYTMPAGIKILGLKYRETGYDTDLTGSFTCDDPFYNKLWQKCQRTLYLTMRDNYMDCPDRERGQWWGDAVNELGEAFYGLSPSAGLLTRKAILNLCFWQRPDKTMFSPVPTGNYDAELPPQMLASVGEYGFWTYGIYSGDMTTMKVAYPHVKDYLSIWKLDGDGLVVHRKGAWDWEDWGDNIDSRVLDNAWFCLALQGASRMAAASGFPEEAAAYTARREALIAAINRHFWDGKAYRDPTYKGATDDRGNALAVVAGIAGPDKYAAVEQVLAQEYHASPYMEKYVLEALARMGDPDAALARMKKRYGAIVASPLTTVPENWDGGSQNHGWSGGPLTILSEYFAGIAPPTPAYETYQVRPQMGSLKQIHTVVDTVRGKIDLNVTREAGHYMLRLVSPPGTQAMVVLPESGEKFRSVKLNGTPAWQDGLTIRRIPGAAFVSAEPDALQFKVGPGTWVFEAE